MAKRKRQSLKRKASQPVQTYYTIETVAQLVALSPDAIRQYETRGLVRSVTVDEDKTYLYTHKEIETLKRIKRLTEEMDVNLAGVEIILNLLEQLEKEAE